MQTYNLTYNHGVMALHEWVPKLSHSLDSHPTMHDIPSIYGLHCYICIFAHFAHLCTTSELHTHSAM